VAVICCWCWGSTAKGVVCLFFPAILNAIHLLANVFHMEEDVSLKLPSVTCNTLEQFYPTKRELLLIFSCLSVRNFLVVFPEP
jgi:hypothetical protein